MLKILFNIFRRQLVAACEKKAVMIFDPLTRRQIFDVAQAHMSCVNGIK